MERIIEPEKLKYLRKKLGLSSKEVAGITGLTSRQWLKYESGEASVPNKTLEYFCFGYAFPPR